MQTCERVQLDAVTTTSMVQVQLLHVAGCPLVDRVRELARRSISRSGAWVLIEELEGDYLSPTLLVDGIDVVTGDPLAPHAACRLDLPTEELILAALQSVHRRGDWSGSHAARRRNPRPTLEGEGNGRSDKPKVGR